MTKHSASFSFKMSDDDPLSFTEEFLEGKPPPKSFYKWLKRGLLDVDLLNKLPLKNDAHILRFIIDSGFGFSSNPYASHRPNFQSNFNFDFDSNEEKSFDLEFTESNVKRVERNKKELIKQAEAFLFIQGLSVELLNQGLNFNLVLSKKMHNSEEVGDGLFSHYLIFNGFDYAVDKGLSSLSGEDKKAFFNLPRTKHTVERIFEHQPDFKTLDVLIKHGYPIQEHLQLFKGCRSPDQMKYLMQNGLDPSRAPYPGVFISLMPQTPEMFRNMLEIASNAMTPEDVDFAFSGLFEFGHVEQISSKVKITENVFKDKNGNSQIKKMIYSLLYDEELNENKASLYKNNFNEHLSYRRIDNVKKCLGSAMAQGEHLGFNDKDTIVLNLFISEINRTKNKAKFFPYDVQINPETFIENRNFILESLLSSFPPKNTQYFNRKDDELDKKPYIDVYHIIRYLDDMMLKLFKTLSFEQLKEMEKLEFKILNYHSEEHKVNFLQESLIFKEIIFKASRANSLEERVYWSDRVHQLISPFLEKNDAKALIEFENNLDYKKRDVDVELLSNHLYERSSKHFTQYLGEYVYFLMNNNDINSKNKWDSIDVLKLYNDFSLYSNVSYQDIENYSIKNKIQGAISISAVNRPQERF